METTLFIQSLRHGLEYFHLPSDAHALDCYTRYFEVLLDWNSRMNLISGRDMDRFVEYHLLDSLKLLSCADFSGVTRILDFGTGAGLPGIPLAIALPHCHITLVDSIQKRTFFLETAVSALSLSNVTVVRARAEELPSSLNASFDAVVTRATVRLGDYFQLCARFIKPGGFLASIKGEQISEELDELRKMKRIRLFNIRDCVPYVPEKVRAGHVVLISGR
jgi:16S rRNA (guanine527-N7)-methyltransferase